MLLVDEAAPFRGAGGGDGDESEQSRERDEVTHEMFRSVSPGGNIITRGSRAYIPLERRGDYADTRIALTASAICRGSLTGSEQVAPTQTKAALPAAALSLS